jgi:ribosome modulation factor
MTKEERQAYQFGEQAAMRGLSRDDCTLRSHDLKAHWLRGWHAWHNAQPAPKVDATQVSIRARLGGRAMRARGRVGRSFREVERG